jgi:2-octaprenyl-6-methoxyphenol hydroxylase
MAEIAIVGAGPLGLATALMLHREGLPVRLFDARPANAPSSEARVLALSEGSRQILGSLGAWPSKPPTPITTIHVSQLGSFGSTRMRASEEGVPALGHVLPATELIEQLQARVAEAAIPIEYDTLVGQGEPGPHGIRLPLSQQAGHARAAVETPLVVCCEGSVRAERGALVHDYQQRALLCRAEMADPHAQCAYERFTPDGPLALLPLGEDYAVVWTQPAARAEALLAADDADWLAALQAAFGTQVRFTAIRDRASYPLALKLRLNPTAPRCVWLGNAAQTLHPVAGQGLNLALRDAWELVEAIRDAQDPGDAHVLARYARSRALDRFAAAGFSDALVRSFGSRLPGLATARGLGLAALDALPPLRHFLARRMIFGARAWP